MDNSRKAPQDIDNSTSKYGDRKCIRSFLRTPSFTMVSGTRSKLVESIFDLSYRIFTMFCGVVHDSALVNDLG